MQAVIFKDEWGTNFSGVLTLMVLLYVQLYVPTSLGLQYHTCVGDTHPGTLFLCTHVLILGSQK